MLTGGISRRQTAENVLANNVAVIGMGTAIAVTPDLPHRWLEGNEATRALKPVTWSDKMLASAAAMALVRYQMRRISRGREPSTVVNPLYALVTDQLRTRRALRRYRSWLKGLGTPQNIEKPAPALR
jgi:hypothetical protein